MYYLLDLDNNIVPVSDVKAWGKAMDCCRRIAFDRVGKIEVSTVFLGLDHSFGGGGEPVLFETMVFGDGGGDEIQQRYCTLEEAKAGHKKILKNYIVKRIEC